MELFFNDEDLIDVDYNLTLAQCNKSFFIVILLFIILFSIIAYEIISIFYMHFHNNVCLFFRFIYKPQNMLYNKHDGVLLII